MHLLTCMRGTENLLFPETSTIAQGEDKAIVGVEVNNKLANFQIETKLLAMFVVVCDRAEDFGNLEGYILEIS